MATKKTKKTTKAVKVTDNTSTETNEEVSPGLALRKQIEEMSEEDRKAAGLKVLKQKAPEGPSNKELFEQATADFEENVLPNIQDMLDGCNFPGAFMIQIGVNNLGKFVAKTKRVRKPYAPRKGSEAQASE